MRIILAKWNAVNEQCLYDNLCALGHEVFSFVIENKVVMGRQSQILSDYIRKINADAVFSFNYICDISDVCEKENILYISWLFDAPQTTLYNKNIFNRCNRIFLFDLNTVNELKRFSVKNVYHIELACDADAFQHTIARSKNKEQFSIRGGVAFLGSLYNEPENDFYSQIKYLPPHLKGFFEGLIYASLSVYGIDMMDAMLDIEIIEEAKKYIHIEISESYYDTYKMRLKNILYKHSAKVVRKRLIESIAEKNELWLYTGSDSSGIKNNKRIHLMGYADYQSAMPLIFSQSCINLNITLRSIISGIPLRVLDILGAKGFLLTNYQPEIAANFENFKDLVIYHDEVELMEYIAYFSKNSDEARQIAASGYKKCAELFNYKRQLLRIFKIV